ncbi:MAG: NnrS family protein [Gammaproteobacteria bacterium]
MSLDNVVSTPTSGRWRTLTAAPHRVMFFGGAIQLVATLLFWAAELTGRYTPWWAPLETTVPATWAHPFLMLYGLFLFFIFGFLMTTYPRWMNGPLVERREYVGAFLLLFAGQAVFYLGLFTTSGLVALGVVLFLVGWGFGIHALLRVFRAAPARDKSYERWLNLAHFLGWLGAAGYLVWILSGEALWLRLSMNLGLWLFLVPLFVTVAHRMVPFFSYCVLPDYQQIQPRWSLPVIWSGFLVHALLELGGLSMWSLFVDLPLGLVILWHSRAWQFRRSLSIRLLAVLHIAVLVLGVAMLFYGVRSIVWLAAGADLLGRAPLHLLGIGFMAAMVIGMATRVSLGHSGRKLEMDRYNWACFWGLILAALLRVLGELPGFNAMVNLNLFAAALWLLSAGGWAVRFLPVYLTPRVDGKPG